MCLACRPHPNPPRLAFAPPVWWGYFVFGWRLSREETSCETSCSVGWVKWNCMAGLICPPFNDTTPCHRGLRLPKTADCCRATGGNSPPQADHQLLPVHQAFRSQHFRGSFWSIPRWVTFFIVAGPSRKESASNSVKQRRCRLSHRHADGYRSERQVAAPPVPTQTVPRPVRL